MYVLLKILVPLLFSIWDNKNKNGWHVVFRSWVLVTSRSNEKNIFSKEFVQFAAFSLQVHALFVKVY